MEEAAIYGTPTIKRIYGDWTSPAIAGWKNPLLKNAITPIQQYSYTTGKNSSDSAMIIDAMDILYSEKTDGFVIVSSDSDFTRLAIRLREAGQRVIGIGERKTPNAFIAACDKFIYIEVIRAGGSQQDENPAEHDAEEARPDREQAGEKARPEPDDGGAGREAAGGKAPTGQVNSQKTSQQQRDKARRQARARGANDNTGGGGGATSVMDAAAQTGTATHAGTAAYTDAAAQTGAAAHADATTQTDAAARTDDTAHADTAAQTDATTQSDAATQADAAHQARVRGEKVPADIVRLIADSVADLAGDDGVVFMGELGNLIQKKKPDFDHRNYGYKSLSAMIKSIDRFEIDFRQTADPNIKHVFVRDKTS